jgi:hypothetical protein
MTMDHLTEMYVCVRSLSVDNCLLYQAVQKPATSPEQLQQPFAILAAQVHKRHLECHSHYFSYLGARLLSFTLSRYWYLNGSRSGTFSNIFNQQHEDDLS